MRLYFEIARRGYRRYAAYPGATFAGLFTNAFFGLLIAYVFLAVYETRDDVGGYSATETVTYVWLTQGLLSVVASFGPSWQELALRIRSGDVAVDLRRPLDLQRALLAEDAGHALHQPNGAGKSTTVKMLTGVLVPTSGRISVAGLDPSRRRIELARRIGVLFGQRVQLWWDLPLIDSFELLRHIYRVPSDRYRTNLARFRELLALDEFLQTPVRQLSLGQRVRGELTATMLHDPEIIVLDEPTIGLDVVAKQRVRGFLAEVNRERGVTVVLTTHDLADIDHYGGERTLIVDLEEPGAPLSVPGARVERMDGPRQWLRFRRDEISAAQLTAAVAALAPILDLTVEEPDIEEVVARIYTRERG